MTSPSNGLPISYELATELVPRCYTNISADGSSALSACSTARFHHNRLRYRSVVKLKG